MEQSEANSFIRIRKDNLENLFSFLKHPHFYPDKLRKVFGSDFFENVLEKVFVVKRNRLLIIHGKNTYSRSLRELIEDFLKEVETNPQGKTSIDPTKQEQRSQELRSVNLFEIDKYGLKGKVVIKSTGKKDGIEDKDREDLVAQFFVLQGLREVFSIKDDELKDQWGGLIRPVDVYGVISQRLEGNKAREHLFMEYGGDHILTNFTGSGYFDPEFHEDLIRFIKHYLGESYNPPKSIDGKDNWLDGLRQALEKRYGIKINLEGRNIVWFEENGRKQYRIIDLKPQYLKKT